mgnify:FL=1
MRLPHVALALVFAALGASSCIFLVDEAAEAGAGGAGGASTATSVTSGGGGTTTSSTGGAGGGGGGLGGGGGAGPTIVPVGSDVLLDPGPIERFARTPLSSGLPLLWAGGTAPSGFEFILADPERDGLPTTFPSVAGVGLALVHQPGESAAVAAVLDTLFLARKDESDVTLTLSACSSPDPPISDLASHASGAVFARCGDSIVAAPVDTNFAWGGPQIVATVGDPQRSRVRVSLGGSSTSYYVLWDDAVDSGGEGVRWCSFEGASINSPQCGAEKQRAFLPPALDDFGYSEQADTVFALAGLELHGSDPTGGMHLFEGNEVAALSVRGAQIAFSFVDPTTQHAHLAVCDVDTQFASLAQQSADPRTLCGTYDLGAVAPPTMLALTADRLHTVTHDPNPFDGSTLRRYALE